MIHGKKESNFKPEVSVIMPAYNADAYICDAIKSVQKQSFEDWELIIVDDCSTDSTLRVAKECSQSDSRISILCMNQNSGVSTARNTALKAASGRHVAFLDSDDMWSPEKLEVQRNFMKDNNSALSFTEYCFISPQNKMVREPISLPSVVSYRQLLKQNIFGCLTVMIDREKAGNVQFTRQGNEDYALWLKILRKHGKAHGLKENLAKYRLVPGSLSANKIRSAMWTWNIYRRNEGLPFDQSLWFFGNYTVNSMRKYATLLTTH